MVSEIHIAVLGSGRCGKAALTARINNLVYRRAGDGRAFQFRVANCREDIALATSCENTDFVLSIFDMNDGYTGLLRAVDLGRKALELRGHSLYVCLVGTKADLLAQDYSEKDLAARQSVAECPWRSGLQCLVVSVVTDQGLNDLCELIVNRIHPSHALWSISGLLRHTLKWFLDAVAVMFSLPVPGNRETPDPLELDSAKIDTLLKTPDAVAWDDRMKTYSFWNVSTVHRITPALVIKRHSGQEVDNMLYVRQHTTIPVPQPRYLHLTEGLVMDLVDGKMLAECWDSLSPLMRFRVACTLRTYISQLRRLTRAVPGPLSGGTFTGTLFDDKECGPFPSFTRFRAWYELIAHSGWRTAVRHRRAINEPIPPPPLVSDRDWPLVFTHTDLSPFNVILSNDGVLWIIDWAEAGFFPPWLEAVGMKNYYDVPNVPKSWGQLHWFITGAYPLQEEMWDYFMTDVHRY